MQNFRPKTCVNSDCAKVYTPNSAPQKWCHDCIKSGVASNQTYRRWRNSVRGRRCKFCGLSDHEVSFRTKTKCGTCYAREARNGVCPKCDFPRHKTVKGRKYCRRCKPKARKTPAYRVTLVNDGQEKTVLVSQNYRFMFRGLRMYAYQLPNPKRIYVDKYDFIRGYASRPRLINLIDECRGSDYSPLEALYMLQDLKNISRTRRLARSWYILRVGSSDLAADRGYYRLGRALKVWGIAHDRDDYGFTIHSLDQSIARLERIVQCRGLHEGSTHHANSPSQ